jgi:putative DNA primase/helicase
MSNNPNGTLMHRDELVSLLSDLSREEKASARGFFLQAWNGTSSYIFDRIGRGRVEIDNVCLSVLGSTQPAKAAPFFYDANNGGAGDDGLIQRFGLVVWPDHNKDWVPSDEGANLTAMNRAHHVFQELDALNKDNIQSGSYSLLEKSRIELEFDQAALDQFVEWRTCLERDLRSDKYPPALESHFSKYRKLVPSIALLFYLADEGRAAVNLDSLNRAIRLSEHLKSHALRAYSSGSVATKEAATRILKKIQSKDLVDGFTARTVYCKDWAGLRDPKIVGSALDLLAEFGYLQEVPVKPKAGGRPTTTYKINPKIK